MMTSVDIRQNFFIFFRERGHEIVPSAPIVVKNDPTLMFTNAGMNQFKDYFLGNTKPKYLRVANTQKCLRVSGKHNDLEEVGVDTYHHTMFEMLGNWSFGDYFKKEAIAWSWELLTKVYDISEDKLYVTVFGGDEKEKLPKDEEAITEWKKWVKPDHILEFGKKDNFWEMGDTGPCGPCTEIHVDCRSDEERKKQSGRELINKDHPQVIEIWNNVFIQFNRLKDGSLEPLPAKHVDTGMGLERLVRVLQNKNSNYDTDIFTGTIAEVEKITKKKYESGENKKDIAFRVIADHIRAIAFTISDGQLPSNTGAGYVIRRILRRAVRYYYSYLDYKKPLLDQLVNSLAKQFENVFPELDKQKDFVIKVIKEEEEAFLRTIDNGTKLFNSELEQNITQASGSLLDTYKSEIEPIISSKSPSQQILELQNAFKGIIDIQNHVQQITDFQKEIEKILETQKAFQKAINFFNESNVNRIAKILDEQARLSKIISGSLAFKLQDTYGFPLDLTKLMSKEVGAEVDEAGFETEMQQQKSRSRAATAIDTEDWIVLDNFSRNEFVGYDSLEIETKVVKYRKIKAKGKESYQIVLEVTPFYAESGGQVGDTGELIVNDQKIVVTDTKKENDLIIHYTDSLPADLSGIVIARVDVAKRKNTELHHSATHLVHAALRKVLGNHVAQKGSLVNDEHLRFDFSHFAAVSYEELKQIEAIVNEKIRENIPVVINEMPKEEAMKLGALALFGEKYGDVVRVVIIDPTYSIELCGGTHVGYTGELGFFLITAETSIAAGVRRIEAKAGKPAFEYIHEELIGPLEKIKMLTKKKSKESPKAVENLVLENSDLRKRIESLEEKHINQELKKILVELQNTEKALIVELTELQASQILDLYYHGEFLDKSKTNSGWSGTFLSGIVDAYDVDDLKKLCLHLKKAFAKRPYGVILTAKINNRAYVALAFDEKSSEKFDASKIIKEHIAPLIKGGGGGQKNFATAGGQDASNLKQVIDKVKSFL